MTDTLTLQQIALLRRVGDGLGLPAYVLRPRNCVQDVELLCCFGLIVSTLGRLTITLGGTTRLRQLDEPAPMHVALGRGRSAGVEQRLQEC